MSDSQPSPDGSGDIIAIKNLQLPCGFVAPDVWGQPKEQPALVSVRLRLRGRFSSAAGLDKLDDSTIHYGTLAKRIRASCKPGQTTEDLLKGVESAIVEMGRKTSGKFIVAISTVEIVLPKGSMFGEGVTLISETTFDGSATARSQSKSFRVNDVKIMTLIGVNSYERTNKQPLVATISLYLDPATPLTQTAFPAPLFKLENELVQVIQETSFETLETLMEYTITQLRERLLDEAAAGSKVHLRIEKPRAIAFADAPVVEVVRVVPPATANANAPRPPLSIKIIKPYSGLPIR